MNISRTYEIDRNLEAAHDAACDRYVKGVRNVRAGQGGFTLIEVSAAFMMMLILSGTIVTLLSQHVFFMQIVNNASFLSEEAPRISALVSTIVNQADSYFIYGSLSDAQSASGTPVLTGGKAVKLTFRNPSGLADESILSYEGGALNYHYKRGGVWNPTPDWVVTSQPKSISFSNDLGLLLIRLVGPEDEVIEFAGSSE